VVGDREIGDVSGLGTGLLLGVLRLDSRSKFFVPVLMGWRHYPGGVGSARLAGWTVLVLVRRLNVSSLETHEGEVCSALV
jgi:hypothetical protein